MDELKKDNPNFTVIQNAVENGADINSTYDERPPIMAATSLMRYDIVQYLIREGADVNKTDAEGATAIRICSDYVNYRRKPIDQNSDYPHYNMNIFKLLIENGAKVDQRSFYLFFVRHDNIFHKDYKTQLELAKIMVEHGCKSYLRKPEVGGRILYFVSEARYGRGGSTSGDEKDQLELVKYLLDNGADPLVDLGNAESPLEISIFPLNPGVSKMFIEYSKIERIKIKEVLGERKRIKNLIDYDMEDKGMMDMLTLLIERSDLLMLATDKDREYSELGLKLLSKIVDYGGHQIIELMIANGCGVEYFSNPKIKSIVEKASGKIKQVLKTRLKNIL